MGDGAGSQPASAASRASFRRNSPAASADVQSPSSYELEGLGEQNLLRDYDKAAVILRIHFQTCTKFGTAPGGAGEK